MLSHGLLNGISDVLSEGLSDELPDGLSYPTSIFSMLQRKEHTMNSDSC